jgi:hypothetical protein
MSDALYRPSYLNDIAYCAVSNITVMIAALLFTETLTTAQRAEWHAATALNIIRSSCWMILENKLRRLKLNEPVTKCCGQFHGTALTFWQERLSKITKTGLDSTATDIWTGCLPNKSQMRCSLSQHAELWVWILCTRAAEGYEKVLFTPRDQRERDLNRPIRHT